MCEQPETPWISVIAACHHQGPPSVLPCLSQSPQVLCRLGTGRSGPSGGRVRATGAPHCCIALNSLFSLTPHLQAEPSVLPSTFQLNIPTDLYHNSTVSRDLRALLQNPRANQHLYQLHQLPALAAAPALPTPPGTLWGGFSAQS